MPDNQINGVDFVLPFRFSDGHWQLGIRRPVSLRIGEIVNQVTARNPRPGALQVRRQITRGDLVDDFANAQGDRAADAQLPVTVAEAERQDEIDAVAPKPPSPAAAISRPQR